jgi:hypothetical protein
MNRTSLFVAGVMLLCSLRVGGAEERYWIAKGDVIGDISYRDAADKPSSKVTGGYQILRPTGEYTCTPLQRQNECRLGYLSDRNGTTKDLRLPRSERRWAKLNSLIAPEGLLRPLKLPDSFSEYARLGGSRDAGTCVGNFEISSPVCSETVSIDDFEIRWTPPDGVGKTMSIVIEKVDGDPGLIRKSAPADSRSFSDKSLREFLLQHQMSNNPVALTIRITAQGGFSAVRMIQIPSMERTRKIDQQFRNTDGQDPLLATIDRMMIALDERMWSRGAREARRLLDIAPAEPQVAKYALVGVCRSDLDDVKRQLRTIMPAEEYDGLCGADPGGHSQRQPPESTEPKPASGGSRRLGVALLIGNSSYLDVPLKSVDNDIQNLSAALEAVGFEVAIRKNLNEPKDFRAALEMVAKDKRAGPDDVLLLYYSGHGLEIEGKTYMLGTGLKATERFGDEIRAHAQSTEEMLAFMERMDPGSRVLIVEACRNDLLARAGETQAAAKRSGFSFNRSGVPNTWVMFANRPGEPTPARSEYGLMGPYTESLISALGSTSGDMRKVFAVAREETMRITQSRQEPVLETSDLTDPLVLRPKSATQLANRAADLLNSAEPLYTAHDWKPYMATLERARDLAADGPLRSRLEQELEFSRHAIEANTAMAAGRWLNAAASSRNAAALFPARRWVTLDSALAFTLANQLEDAVGLLWSVVAAPARDEIQARAEKLLQEILAAMPELGQFASGRKDVAGLPGGAEFETWPPKE